MMHYAVKIRAAKTEKAKPGKGLMPKLIEDVAAKHTFTPKLDSVIGEIDGDRVLSSFHVNREVKGTEAVKDEEGDFQVEVDNKKDIVDLVKADLKEAAWYEISVHCCNHDEEINRPCSPWQVEAKKGKIPK